MIAVALIRSTTNRMAPAAYLIAACAASAIAVLLLPDHSRGGAGGKLPGRRVRCSSATKRLSLGEGSDRTFVGLAAARLAVGCAQGSTRSPPP
jgi:hypothetical protein